MSKVYFCILIATVALLAVALLSGCVTYDPYEETQDVNIQFVCSPNDDLENSSQV